MAFGLWFRPHHHRYSWVQWIKFSLETSARLDGFIQRTSEILLVIICIIFFNYFREKSSIDRYTNSELWISKKWTIHLYECDRAVCAECVQWDWLNEESVVHVGGRIGQNDISLLLLLSCVKFIDFDKLRPSQRYGAVFTLDNKCSFFANVGWCWLRAGMYRFKCARFALCQLNNQH